MRLRLVSRFRRMPRVTGVLVSTLILGQGAILSPLVASELRGRADTLARWGAQAATAVQRRLPERPVRVNRTVPKVSPPNLAVSFSANPTVEALASARVFSHPLSPVGGVPSREENAALARTMELYAQAGERPLRAQLIEDYLAASPQSPWRAGVALNLGTILWRQGFFSRAARYFTEAWEAAKNDTTANGRAIGDSAIAELLTHQMTFGQLDAMDARLSEVEGRPVRGGAGSKVDAARMGAYTLRNHHETAVFSGPAALQALIDKVGSPRPDSRTVIKEYLSPHSGTSLGALVDLADRAGLRVVARHVTAPAEIPVPAVVHFKSQHFSTLFERKDGAYVMRDPALGGIMTLSEAAVADEMTGFVILPAAGASTGRAVSSDERTSVIGHCVPGVPDWEDCDCEKANGMPVARLNKLTASVNLADTPLFYSPPRGPGVQFHLRYNQRTTRLAQVPSYSHIGALWSHDWLSWVEDNNTSFAAPYSWENVVVRGFGVEQYNGYDGTTYWRTRAKLTKVAHDPPHYERALPDGSVEVFTFPDRAASLPQRRVFLTQLIDPQGQTLSFTYDAQVRLVSLTDAVGQVTTLSYEDATDPLRITKVTDPFGRTAILTYDGLGRIATLTDALGMTSSIAYEADDFVQALTTPYGTTSFRRGPDSLAQGNFKRIELTDPEGGTERIEYHLWGAALGLATSVPVGEVPAGFSDLNQGLDMFNSLHWDKRAMAEAPGDVSRATIVHWLARANMSYQPTGATFARRIPHSIKRPLETRVWYRYPDQGSYVAAGTGQQPSQVARLLEGGATQLRQASYNANGMVTSQTDPLGRQTVYTYDANGRDLLEVRQVSGGSTDVIVTYAGYNGLHLPTTVTDAAGQTSTTVYNAAGRPLTVTNARNEVTTFTYQAGTGLLQTVTGPVANSTTVYAYDAYGRVSSITQPDGYAITMVHDALNRLTRTTYPDGTYEETTFNRLDVATERDRNGRVTRHFYDGLGRRTSTRNHLGMVLTRVWCACGLLDAVTDSRGAKTAWERDTRGRVVKEIQPGGDAEISYSYDVIGRLKSVTDAKSQVATYTRNADDSIASIAYTNSAVSTPTVTYTYDAFYPRVTAMQDAIGSTAYSYHPAGGLGAGRLATINGPLSNDTIALSYDELGRATSRSVNGSANSVQWTFDALSRVSSEQNLLGEFLYEYDGPTDRLSSVTFPNDQTTEYSYSPASLDNRLTTIDHKSPSGASIEKYDYSYDKVGNILSWRQQHGSNSVSWRLRYDAIGQMTQMIEESTDLTPIVLSRSAFAYDLAGNRSIQQEDDQVTLSSHDLRDRLVSRTPGGPLEFVGDLSETASVTINGNASTVDSTNRFTGAAVVSTGTTTVNVVATDPSGNTSSRQYEVDIAGTAKTFTYDANGNMISDGVRTFGWSAKNQLVTVTGGGATVAIDYNGTGFPARVTTTLAGQSQVAELIWLDGVLLEERTQNSVKRLFAFGYSDTAAFYSLRDHLGSVRAVTTAAGSVAARYNYSAAGVSEVSEGLDVSPVKFSGKYEIAGGLLLFPYRTYDPSLGRWLSVDPLGLSSNSNPHEYAAGNPVSAVDPLGLAPLGPLETYYFTGNGDPKSLAQLGLMEEFLASSVVRKAQEGWNRKTKSQAEAIARGLCNVCPSGVKATKFYTGAVESVDFKGLGFSHNLWALGSTSLRMNGTCELSADCNFRTYWYRCRNTATMNDAFVDALDVINRVPDEWLILDWPFGLGHPYAVDANWTYGASGSGMF